MDPQSLEQEVTEEITASVDGVGNDEKQAVSEQVGEDVPQKVEETPAYEPNFKYSVMDVEKEFDERLRGIIKSKEDEDYIRDLVTRAEGMENDKRSYSKLKEDHQVLNQEYETMRRDVEQVLKMRDNGDLGPLFETLGIKKDQLMKYAYQVAQYQDLTPEQRAYYDRQQEIQRDHYNAQQQNEILMQRLQQIELQTSQSELMNKLNNTEISPIVKAFDARNGQQAFYNEVVRRGAMYEAQSGQTKQADELIQEIVNLYGLDQTFKPQVAETKMEEPPVIPNTGGSGSGTPVKRKPKSLKDLEAMASGYED